MFSGNPYMTAAQPPSWFEPEPSLLIGRAPAKAKPHWSDHSLSFPGRLEGTLHSWLVALKQPKKAPAPKVLERKSGRKQLQIRGLRKSAAVELRMSSVKEASALFACSKCFTRHPFEELSQGQQLCKVRRTILS